MHRARAHGAAPGREHAVGTRSTPTPLLPPGDPPASVSMGGMVAQELAVLLATRCRLVSLSLSVTCRGLRLAAGPLAPLCGRAALAPLLAWWFRGSAERRARLIMWKVGACVGVWVRLPSSPVWAPTSSCVPEQ
jgi:hypothetical protein